MRVFLEESKERRKKMDDLIEKVVTVPISNTDSAKEDDADMHFCKSLAPTLRRLDRKSNMKAKIEIQKILVKYEFGPDE